MIMHWWLGMVYLVGIEKLGGEMRRNIATDVGHEVFDESFSETSFVVFGSFQPRVDADRELDVVDVVPPVSGYEQDVARMQKDHVRMCAADAGDFRFVPLLEVDATVDAGFFVGHSRCFQQRRVFRRIEDPALLSRDLSNQIGSVRVVMAGCVSTRRPCCPFQ